MTLVDRLREWDQQLLPHAAARLRRLVRAGSARWQRWEQVRSPGVRVLLTGLDTRYAGRWPLRLVREVPQLGFVVIAAVFLAGTGSAVVLHPAAPAPAVIAFPGSSDGGDAGPVRLGPDVGTTTTDYVAAANRSLAAAARSRQPHLALVSFGGYRTPAQVALMLAGVPVRRVYLRATVGGPDATQRPVDLHGGLLDDLRGAYAKAAQASLEAHKSYETYVATTNDDKPFQQLYAAFAASTAREARAYQTGCACVFAAVVEAKTPELLVLRSRQGVRAVEVSARQATLHDVLVLPLLPEVSGPVPRVQTPGDPSH